jgi:hypothetical protein
VLDECKSLQSFDGGVAVAGGPFVSDLQNIRSGGLQAEKICSMKTFMGAGGS